MTNTAPKLARNAKPRRATTLEMAEALCPTDAQALRVAESFGLDPVAGAHIHEETQNALIRTAEALSLGEKAMEIHLQRVVGAYVGSAFGAGEFYSKAVSDARNLTAKLGNDDRDEDLDGPVGFAGRAQRKREFAAEMGLQAFALVSAAQGAVAAYQHVTGETWKPYERRGEDAVHTVNRQAAAAQLAAFG